MHLPFLARLALPYVRAELPGWYRLYRAIGGEDEARWSQCGERSLASRFHPYPIPVRLSNWSERKSWFLGRYYELETQLCLQLLLQPGDVFVDVGANIGMLSLVGAQRVGPTGIVVAVEPNPVPAARLSACLAAHRIAQVQLHQVGLADREEELELRIVGAHTGAGSFAPVDAADLGQLSFAQRVRVVRGDELLAGVRGAARSAWTIKVDVEGFECRVLRGLERTLRERRPALITETIPAQLARAGSSTGELFDLLGGQGYQAFALRTRRAGLRRRLALQAVPAPSPGLSDDLLWLLPDGPARARLAPCLI